MPSTAFAQRNQITVRSCGHSSSMYAWHCSQYLCRGAVRPKNSTRAKKALTQPIKRISGINSCVPGRFLFTVVVVVVVHAAELLIRWLQVVTPDITGLRFSRPAFAVTKAAAPRAEGKGMQLGQAPSFGHRRWAGRSR
jgi:hypothetical protein